MTATNPDQMTAAEQARVAAAIAAKAPVRMTSPEGKTSAVQGSRVAAREAAGWTRA